MRRMNQVIIISIIALLSIQMASAAQGTVSIRILKTDNQSYTQTLQPYIDLVNNNSQARGVIDALGSDSVGLKVYSKSELYLYEVGINDSRITRIKESQNISNTDLKVAFPLDKANEIEEKVSVGNYSQILPIIYKNVQIPIILKVRLSLYMMLNKVNLAKVL